MPNRIASLLLILPIGVLATETAPAQIDFYERQLQAGKNDFQINRPRQALDELRIAAFGLLDRPALLTEALVRLTVAQTSLGMNEDSAKTIDRFLEVEQRFPSYASLQIEPTIRSRFEDALVKAVPRATLQSIPGLARLTNYELSKVAALPAAQRIAAYEAGARREPENAEWPLALARESDARGATADVIRWATKVLQIQPQNKEAQRLLLHAYVARRQCPEAAGLMKSIAEADLQAHPEMYADEAVCFAETARWNEAAVALSKVPENLRRRPDVARASQLLTKANEIVQKSASTPRSSDVLETAARLIHAGKYDEAARELQAALKNDPNNRGLHRGLLEAAVLSKDWKTASAQVNPSAPFADGEELYMFYAAVALYETGQKSAAKSYMLRARPHMEAGPMVDRYMKAILGDGA